MSNIFLKKSEYEIIESTYVDEDTVVYFIKFNDMGISKFKNIIKDDKFNLGLISKKEEFSHKLFKGCSILGRTNTHLIILTIDYTGKNVNISDYRKDKIKNFLKD